MMKISNINTQYLYLIMVFAVVTAALFGYALSPFSYSTYLHICHVNYSTAQTLNQCMQPFWDQYKIGKVAIAISALLLAVAAVFIFQSKLKRKSR